MIEHDKIIEKAKQSLSFIEQLQEQVTACRRLLSHLGGFNESYFSLKAVEGLEILLWAKLMKDEDYQKEITKINEWYNPKVDKANKLSPRDRNPILASLYRKKAMEQFKLLLIFIDKKDYMPIGDEDDG